MTRRFRLLAALSGVLLLASCASQPRRAAEAPPAPPPRIELPPLPAEGEPKDLVGIAPEAVRLAFGRPDFVRKEGVGELWRYDSAKCKAFFFLYTQDGGLKVRHVETLPRGFDMAADAACLNALRVTKPVS